MMLHLTDEESVNSSLNICTQGACSGFRFIKWLHRYQKTRNEKHIDTELENACSAFRGGYSTSDTEASRELILNLSGTNDARLDGNFIFLGDRSDLSYFWKKADAKNHTVLLQKYIDSIPDDELRRRVIGTMTKARVDGILKFDNGEYSLTERGRHIILNSDFVLDRLKKECKALGIASAPLNEQAKEMRKARIDEKLEALGLTGKFDNCDVITANRSKLYVKDDGGLHTFYVPNTQRRATVDIPSDHVIRLDEKTYALFIEKNSDYTAVIDGKKDRLNSSEMLKSFEDKNELFVKRASDAENIAKEQVYGNFNEDEFMALALRKSYADAAFAGKEYTVFSPDGKENTYSVTSEWLDLDGVTYMNMRGDNGDILLPEDCIERVAFENADVGRQFVKDNADIVSDYSKFFESYSSTETFCVDKKYYTENADTYSISSHGGAFERIEIPKADCIKQDDNTLTVTVKQGQKYTVTSGAYKSDVTSANVSRTLGKTAQTVNTASQTTNAAGLVSASIPPVEGVSASAKAVTAAISSVTQTVSIGNSLSQRI